MYIPIEWIENIIAFVFVIGFMLIIHSEWFSKNEEGIITIGIICYILFFLWVGYQLIMKYLI